MQELINSNSVHQYNYNISFWDSQCIEIHSCNNYKYIFSIKYLHILPFLCGFHSLPEKDRGIIRKDLIQRSMFIQIVAFKDCLWVTISFLQWQNLWKSQVSSLEWIPGPQPV